MNCLITRDKIKESISDAAISHAVESVLFEKTGPHSISAPGATGINEAHLELINTINAGFQDNVLIPDQDNPYGFVTNPSPSLVDAYERKMSSEIAAQTEQIGEGSVKTRTPQSLTRVNDFLNRVGVNVQEVNSIVVNGQKLDAEGVALPLQSLILHTTGSDGGVLTEEAMHIGVELLSQKNKELYDKINKQIVDFPIYKETFREYSGIKEYQVEGTNRPDIQKIKTEAIGKLLTQVYTGQETSPKAVTLWSQLKEWLSKFFKPLKDELSDFKESVDAILGDDMGTVRETLLQSPEYLYDIGFTQPEIERIMNLSKSMMTDAELRVALGDISPKLVYMKATPTVERRAQRVNDEGQNITEDKGQVLYKGKPVKETDLSIALRKLGEKIAKTNPLYKGLESSIANNESSESHLVVQDVLSKYLDKEGFPKDIPADALLKGKSIQYETVARAVLDKINSFPVGTKFLTNTQIADKNAAATVDLIAIDPTETFNLINWQQVELKNGQRPEQALTTALQSKMEVARNILARGYNVSKFGETRTMLINVREEDGTQKTEATLVKTPAMDYLAPIPSLSETLGSTTLDSIYSEMYNIDRKKRVITGRKTERELTNNKTLTGLLSSFRALQISRTVEPLARQVADLADRMDELSQRYREEIKGKGIDNTSPVIKQIIEDMATYITIGETLKKVQDGVSEINANSPGVIERYELKQLARATGDLNEAYSALNLQAKDIIDSYVASPRGIRDINEPELIQNWLARGSRTSSMSSQASIQLLHKLSSEGQHRAELNHNEFLKNLTKVKETYSKFMKSKGLTAKTALDPITQKNPDGTYAHRLIEKVSREFYDKAKEALQSKNIDWVKDNIDLKQYDEWFQSQKEEQFSFIESTITPREDEDVQPLIDSYKEEWLDRYDLSRGLNESNTKIYNFPIESKFLSEDYKKLTSKGNEPALELYNLIQEMNTNAVNAGVLDEFVAKTFIPFRNKAAIDDLIFGKGVSADKARKEFFKPKEEFYHYGDYSPDSSSKRRIPFGMIQDISKRHINEKGEVIVDYSNVSTDVFDLLSAYNYQTETYTNYSDIEAASQLLVAVERSKGSKATNKTTGNAIEGGGIVENVHNLETLNKFVMAEVYGKKYDDIDINGVITLSMNSVAAMANRKFGTNFNTEQKELKIPVKEFLDTTRSYFIFKTLGANPATAITNYLGTNMQASLDAGQYFTKGQFLKNNMKVFSERLIGGMTQKEKTALLGAIDYFIPLVDNENNQGKDSQMSFNKLAKYNMSHTLMGMLRASDRPVQYSVAGSYIENTIILDGELQNVREYLRDQEKYVKMYDGTEESRKALQSEFEQEAQDLINTKGVLNNIEFDSDGHALIKGIDRNSDTVINLRERIQQISKNATGMGTNNEYRLFNSSIVGRNLSMFFSWAPRLIDKRFQDLRYVTALDQMEWGRLRTFANYINKALTESGSNLVDLYKVNDRGAESLKQEFQRQVEKYEANTGKHYYERGANEEFNRKAAERDFIEMYQRNVKTQYQEFVLLATLGSMLLLAAKLPPDDEEYKGIHKYSVKIARKVLGEISFFYNPMSILDITNGKVFPGAAVIHDSVKTFNAIHDQFFGDEEQKEKAKPLGKIIKMVPGVSQVLPILAIFNEEIAKELNYSLPNPTITEPSHNN